MESEIEFTPLHFSKKDGYTGKRNGVIFFMAKKKGERQNNELMIAVVVACFLGVAAGFYMGKNSVDVNCPVTPVVRCPSNSTVMQKGITKITTPMGSRK